MYTNAYLGVNWQMSPPTKWNGWLISLKQVKRGIFARREKTRRWCQNYREQKLRGGLLLRKVTREFVFTFSLFVPCLCNVSITHFTIFSPFFMAVLHGGRAKERPVPYLFSPFAVHYEEVKSTQATWESWDKTSKATSCCRLGMVFSNLVIPLKTMLR